MKASQFVDLMHRLAAAWTEQDTDAALACFTPDAVYLEPPDVQFYRGHDQLRAYFGALTAGTTMRFHQLWFDEAAQTGAGEFTFGHVNNETADHGVVVVELAGGRIAVWREYPRKGPAEFESFAGSEGKDWQWHIGNYP
ncbi:MAG TPA: nuclear transport factor 2 family protein [Anaerolineales bacterium]|nr:nuclear transport factor 2 family protein [Anaerolineales bacterium]